MIVNWLTESAETAAARYALLTDGWRSIFDRSLSELDFGSSTHVARTIREIYLLGDLFIQAERRAIEEEGERIAREAHQTTLREIASIDATELSERVTEHLRATEQYLIDELIAQVHRDVALVRQTLRRVALEVSVAARSRGMSDRMALTEYRIGNGTTLDFAFQDRANRKWGSRRYVRTLWRHTLLSVYNEVVMLTLSDHGLRRARVVTQEPGAQSHGMLISFGSNADLSTYSEIRDVVFHPNANAYLAMETVDVSA